MAIGDDSSVRDGAPVYSASDFPLARLLEAKRGRTVSVCIPARDEASTVGNVVRVVAGNHLAEHGGSGLVDELVVVDDGSTDGTGEIARAAGARVISAAPRGAGRGKGQTMAAGLAAAGGDVVVFLDADVGNTEGWFVSGLVGPLLTREDITLVKGFYERPIEGAPTGGGRVTELMARPLIEVLFPELSGILQPLAGETAAHRWVLEKVSLSGGYGVELGLLVDIAQRFGAASIAQVDLGVRFHRNRPLSELRPQAVDILRTALARVPTGPDVPLDDPPSEVTGGEGAGGDR